MTAPAASHPMLSALAAEVAVLSRFVELLRREQASLASGIMDPLPAFTAEKARIVIELQQTGARRTAMLRAAGLDPDSAGMSAWLGKQPADLRPALQRGWRAFLALVAESRQLNDTNGVIVRARLKHNQQALAVLAGAAGTAGLYGADGASRVIPPRRTIGVA
jgi:flagella synthesis protein FlgN